MGYLQTGAHVPHAVLVAAPQLAVEGTAAVLLHRRCAAKYQRLPALVLTVLEGGSALRHRDQVDLVGGELPRLPSPLLEVTVTI